MSLQLPSDLGGPWARYTPSAKVPWNLRRVVHLHRRAGFAATWAEIQRDLADGPEASIDRFLTGKATAQGVPDGFEQTATVLADAAVASNDPARLKAWWLYRMLFSPDPLTERLTLLWHNHFATSNAKVDDLAAMRRQNDLFRELARAPFGRLLDRAVRDPALLVWLDAPANRKGRPNENLARELMELFTLGIGHFTEADVREAARALTGWSVSEGVFCEVPLRHDAGEKTILGRKGAWRGDDLVRMLQEHPATAERLAVRLGELFLGERVVGPADVHALAVGLRQHQLEIGWAIETVLRSQAFFADANLGSRIAGPVEHVVGALRALEWFDPPPSTLLLAEWTARLGQNLFYPPNVGGWVGGRAWLNTQAIVGRANYAAALVNGKLSSRQEPWDVLSLARRQGRGEDLNGVVAFFGELLLGAPPQGAFRDRLRGVADPGMRVTEETARRVVALLLAAPEMQMT